MEGMKLLWLTGLVLKEKFKRINNIPIEIPSHPYVLLHRTILCNCIIEVENNFSVRIYCGV